jgi:MFS family permease
VTFVIFYICTAYLLSYNVRVTGISLLDALKVQIYGSVLFGLATTASGKLGDRFGRRELLIATVVAIAAFSLAFRPLLTAGIGGIYVFATTGMVLVGLNYGVLGAALTAPFPTQVRYSGSSITFTLAGILGASLAPYIATWLQTAYGINYVGYCLLVTSLVALASIFASEKIEI